MSGEAIGLAPPLVAAQEGEGAQEDGDLVGITEHAGELEPSDLAGTVRVVDLAAGCDRLGLHDGSGVADPRDGTGREGLPGDLPPVQPDDLIEVHTRKIHLLINDRSLSAADREAR